MRKVQFAAALAVVSLVVGGLAAPAAASDDATRAMMSVVNDQLTARGAAVRLSVVEYLTAEGAETVGRTVFFDNRGNRQLAHDFVPCDPRRGGFCDITYLVDQVDAATDDGLAAADTTAAIDRAMGTWDAETCSTLPLTRFPDLGIDWGYVQSLLGYGGIAGWLADVTHAGWLPAGFFDAIAPNGSARILGVTFTLTWIGPTDIDGNGKADVAFREIYYNDNFPWAIDAHYDVESVALHEAGHGLSQAHFGAAFRTPNGKLHFSPRAVMNAAYTGLMHDLTASDRAGHCSNWAAWPGN